MDFIRALRHHAPASAGVDAAAAQCFSEVSESSVHQQASALSCSAENSSPCADNDVVSGGLSHFLEAECFLSRLKQLIASVEQLCKYGRAAHSVQGGRTAEQRGVPVHRSRGMAPQGAQGAPVNVTDSLSPRETDRRLVSDGPEHLRADPLVSEVSYCVRESVSAVVFCVATLEIYQSQPTLLDPYLSQMVKPLSDVVVRNLELLTPLSIPEIQAELTQILTHRSCDQARSAAPADARAVPTAPASPTSLFPSSVPSSRPAGPSSCLQSHAASASALSVSSSSHLRGLSLVASASTVSSHGGALCSPVINYLLECSHSQGLSEDAASTAAACNSETSGAPGAFEAASSECRYLHSDTGQRAATELGNVFLRTAASVALRLVLHLLYVVSRVRGYKSVRQLLPSEPELLEVIVGHCEALLAAEFLRTPCPVAAGADNLPAAANSAAAAPAVYGEEQQPDGATAVGRAATQQGRDSTLGDRTENNCWRNSEALLAHQMQQIMELLQQLPLWSTHYSLLLWLSLLVLAPFDLDSLDSAISADADTEEQQQKAAAATVLPHEGTFAQDEHGRPVASVREEKDRTEKTAAPTEGQKCFPRQQLPLRLRLIVLVVGYLRSTSSKASDAAALVVARFFSRPDACTKGARTFSAFLTFCQEVLDKDNTGAAVGEGNFREDAPASCCRVVHSASGAVPLFAKANALRALNEVLKNISRASALPQLPTLLHLVGVGEAASSSHTVAATASAAGGLTHESLQQSTRTGEEEHVTKGCGTLTASQSALFRKLRCSCATRICMLLLPPVCSEAYRWRYTQHARNLEAYLKQMPLQQTLQQREKFERERATGSTDRGTPPQKDTVDEDVPDAVEEVMGLQLDSLQDRDTVVRWAAAKAIGRVVLQLPRSFASQVVASILERMEDATSYYPGASGERLWHGSCLALGELLRRGLVDPAEHLAVCTKRLCCALALDNSGRASLQGSSYSAAAAAAEQLRDAACFAVWSLARAYHHTEALEQQIKPLSEALLLVALFDREVNCRRAAAAAFQELEGRQGGILHGLSIVTTADFFALATRRSAYLKVAPQVAALDSSYCDLLLNTLVRLLLQEGDEEMRTFTAAAIKRIAKLKPGAALEGFVQLLLQTAAAERESLPARHGALLGLTAFLEALTSLLKQEGDETAATTTRETGPRRDTATSRKGGETAASRETSTLKRTRALSGGAPARQGTPALAASTSEGSAAAKHGHAGGGPGWGSRCMRQSAEERAAISAGCSGDEVGVSAAAAASRGTCLLGDKLQTSLRQLVVVIEKQRLYRGKGGDMIRSGVCVFIQALATSKCIAFKQATARRYIVTLMEGLRHFSDGVQLAAAEALRALLRERLTAQEALQEVVPQLLQRLQNSSEHVAARRGYVLALATLPAEVYRRACSSPPSRQGRERNSGESLDLLTVLQREAVSYAPLSCPSLGDAQTRRNAVVALAFAVRALLTVSSATVSAAADERGRKEVQQGQQTAGEKDLFPGGSRLAVAAASTAAAAPDDAERRAAVERCAPAGEESLCTATGSANTRADTEDGFPAAEVAPPSKKTTEVRCCVAARPSGSGPGKKRTAAAQPLLQAAGEKSVAEGTREACEIEEQRSRRDRWNVFVLKQICSTLETCSVDYQVDRRGDVGSWVREVAAEVVTFLLENLSAACSLRCSCFCADGTDAEREREDEQQATSGHSASDHIRDGEGHTCITARMLSILVRMSLESLDRTRSRAVFLLYHLVAPLPPADVFCDGSQPPTPFKVEWIWNRIFYDFSYESVSANLTPRLDLLRAGPSPCFFMPTKGRRAPLEKAAPNVQIAANMTAATSAAPPATLTDCALLVTVLQHTLLPLAENQANALEFVKPRVPFHNLNLSEFAVNRSAAGAVSEAAGLMQRTEEPGRVRATAHAVEDKRPAVDAKRNGSIPGTLEDAFVSGKQPNLRQLPDTNDTGSFLVERAYGKSPSVRMIGTCGKDAGDAEPLCASYCPDTDPSQQASSEIKSGTCSAVKKHGRAEENAREPLGTEEHEFADYLLSSCAAGGSFDFLLEASVGDGGRASLHKTRKAGVLLRLPLFTDSAATYPPLLLLLLTHNPFCQAAAQGVCLGVGAFAGRSSERAAQALLAFLTGLRHAEGTGTRRADTRDGRVERANAEQQEGRNEQQMRTQAPGQSPVALCHTTEQQATTGFLSEFGGMGPRWKKKTVAHGIGTLFVDVLEDSSSVQAEKASKGEARYGLHSEKMCLATLRTITLISNFVSSNDRCRLLKLLMTTLDDGIWRRSFQYSKARCKALVALLAAGSVSAPVDWLWDRTTKKMILSGETLARAAAAAESARKLHREALCATLQYLNHRLRQLAAEELYASLLLPLSETHGDSSDYGSTEAKGKTETTLPCTVYRPEACRPFVLTAPQAEEVCQILTGTPWMELSTTDTRTVETLARLFDVCLEWEQIRSRGRRD